MKKKNWLSNLFLNANSYHLIYSQCQCETTCLFVVFLLVLLLMLNEEHSDRMTCEANTDFDRKRKQNKKHRLTQCYMINECLIEIIPIYNLINYSSMNFNLSLFFHYLYLAKKKTYLHTMNEFIHWIAQIFLNAKCN